MNAILEARKPQIAELCRSYRVERLDLFGSAATGEFDEMPGDYDFIVRFENSVEPGVAHRYLELAERLEAILEHPVDLLTDRAFRNPYFAQSVQETRTIVYEQGSEEVPV
jgi:predicted nucleotidyltransferase